MTSRSGKVIRVCESIDMNLLACLLMFDVPFVMCSSAINGVFESYADSLFHYFALNFPSPVVGRA